MQCIHPKISLYIFAHVFSVRLPFFFGTKEEPIYSGSNDNGYGRRTIFSNESNALHVKVYFLVLQIINHLNMILQICGGKKKRRKKKRRKKWNTIAHAFWQSYNQRSKSPEGPKAWLWPLPTTKTCCVFSSLNYAQFSFPLALQRKLRSSCGL